MIPPLSRTSPCPLPGSFSPTVFVLSNRFSPRFSPIFNRPFPMDFPVSNRLFSPFSPFSIRLFPPFSPFSTPYFPWFSPFYPSLTPIFPPGVDLTPVFFCPKPPRRGFPPALLPSTAASFPPRHASRAAFRFPALPYFPLFPARMVPPRCRPPHPRILLSRALHAPPARRCGNC